MGTHRTPQNPRSTESSRPYKENGIKKSGNFGLEFTHSQCFETFVRCHVHAFTAFNGVSREIYYDNLATAVAEHDGRPGALPPAFPGLRPRIRLHPTGMQFGQWLGKRERGTRRRWIRAPEFLAVRTNRARLSSSSISKYETGSIMVTAPVEQPISLRHFLVRG